LLAHPALIILLGILAGVIPGLFGGGGGWLLVPILVLAIGETGWAYASGTVLCAFLSGVTAGVVGVWLADRSDGKTPTPSEGLVTLVIVVSGVVGAILGKAVLRDWLAGFQSATTWLDAILIAALVVIAWRMLYEVYSKRYEEGAPRPPTSGHLATLGLLCLVPGVLSGLIGIGGGILYVPILMMLLHWRPDEARNAARICVFASSVIAAGLYARSGGVHLATAAGMFIPSGIVGVIFSAIRFGRSERRRKTFKLLASGMAGLALVLTAIHMFGSAAGKAQPCEPGSLATVALALYVPVSWGALCALGQHFIARKLRPGEPADMHTAWFYQI